MKMLIQISLLFLLVSSAFAQESSALKEKVLRVYDWKDLNVQSSNCQIVSVDGMSVLKIENTNGESLEISLLTITNSSLLQKANSIEWEMKYDLHQSTNSHVRFGMDWRTNEKFHPQVMGGDNITNNGGGFSFTDASRNWDKYHLQIMRAPYDNLTRPDELECKLFLRISGIVYLRPIKLLGVASNWWSPQQIGLIGGIGGSVIGCFGALLGLLASKGKARNFVLATMKMFIALGILLTIAGFVAVVSSQPYAVWYALLLPGVILTLVFSLNLPSIQRRYDELEIRRMTSVDTMGS